MFVLNTFRCFRLYEKNTVFEKYSISWLRIIICSPFWNPFRLLGYFKAFWIWAKQLFYKDSDMYIKAFRHTISRVYIFIFVTYCAALVNIEELKPLYTPQPQEKKFPQTLTHTRVGSHAPGEGANLSGILGAPHALQLGQLTGCTNECAQALRGQWSSHITQL